MPWTYATRDLKGEEFVGAFYEKKKKKMLKTNQKEFRVEKGIKSEGDKIYVKRKSYNNSFNSWIDKKEIA